MWKSLVLFSLVVSSAYSVSFKQWSQCGGEGWTGSTDCSAGFVCTVQNQWYHQCLPGEPGDTTTTTTRRPEGGVTACTEFTKGSFNTGIAFGAHTVTNMPSFDYVSIWMNTIDDKNSTAWNQWYQGAMLDWCKLYKKTPLFYAYVIAFEARVKGGLQDCDVHPTNNLCYKGAKFIRENRAHILDKYDSNAYEISQRFGKDDPVIFVMEPDYWQYYGDVSTQEGGTLSGEYARALFDDMVRAIKYHLPKAMISWDISAWIGQDGFRKWWDFFKTADIDFIHTSGGQARGELSNIKPGELEWKFVSQTTGKRIIADCGYGVAGGASPNCGVWTDLNNVNSRISDGVVALTMTYVPGTIPKPGVSC